MTQFWSNFIVPPILPEGSFLFHVQYIILSLELSLESFNYGSAQQEKRHDITIGELKMNTVLHFFHRA